MARPTGRAKVAACLLLFNLGGIAAAAPPGQPQDARGSLALYCAEECGELDLQGFGLRTRLPAVASAPTVVVRDVTDTWARPTADQLAAWGEGNTTGMAEAGQVVLVEWATPREAAATTLAEVLRVSIAASSWLEDPDTGRLMSPFAARGLAGDAAQEAPDVARLATVEIHQDDGGPAILATRGLLRLGLPDLVEVGVPAGEVQVAAARLNAVAQALYETGVVSVLEVDATRFASPTARAAACELKGTARLSYDRGNKAILGPGLRASLDGFDGAFGTCEEGEAAAMASPSPAEAPAAEAAPPQDDLAAARTRAIRRLRGEIRTAFQAGLPAGERLLVKAPFQAPDGRVEWLWLQVAQWQEGDVLVGTMASQPAIATGVAKGDSVQARLDLVFDYLWVHADGSQEGNETQQYL